MLNLLTLTRGNPRSLLFQAPLLLAPILTLLSNRDFPNGMFAMRDLFFLLSIPLICGGILFYENSKNASSIKLLLNPINALSCLFLVALPLFQFLFQNITSFSLIKSIGLYLCVLSVFIFGRDIHWILLTKRYLSIVIVTIATHTLINVLQFLEYLPKFHGLYKISGMFSNPGPSAIFTSSLLIPIATLFWFTYKSKLKIQSILLFIILIANLHILMELKSRSAFIGLSVTVIFFLYGFIKTFHPRFLAKVKISWLTALLLIVFGGAFYLLYQIRPDSANGRLLVWISTIHLISENFLLGIGIGKFPSIYPHFQATALQNSDTFKMFSEFSGESIYAFNDLLHIISERGIIGVIAFIAIIVITLRNCSRFKRHRSYRYWRLVVVGGIGSTVIIIFVSGITSYPLQILPINLWFWVVVSLLNTICYQDHARFKAFQTRPTVIFNALFVLSALFYFFYGTFRLHGYLEWIRFRDTGHIPQYIDRFSPFLENEALFFQEVGEYYFAKGNNAKAICYFKKSISYDFNKKHFYSLGKAYTQSGNFGKAMDCYQKIENAIPHLITPSYLLARLYYNQNSIIPFQRKAKEALRKEPKVNSYEVRLMKRELKFLLNEVDKKTPPIKINSAAIN